MQQQLFKIRDLRKKDQFKIDDKYLNGYSKYLGLSTLAVYASLSRHSEYHTQSSFPSEKLIADEHSITERSVRLAIRKLKLLNIIKVERERTAKGKWLNNIYILIDKSEWKEPEEIKALWVSRGNKRHKPEEIKDKTRGTDAPIKDNTVEGYNIKDNTSIVGQADKEWNFENKLNELLKDKRRDLQIIALYWQFKDINFFNYKQWQAGLRRELKPAQNLTGYSNDELSYVMDWLSENANFKWSLETLHKYIDEDLDNIKIKK